MSEETDPQKGFKVNDRRRFTDEGETREEQPAEDAQAAQVEPVAEPAAESGPEPTAGPSEAPPPESRESREELPSINFPTFIISLSTQALMHLGEVNNPVTGQVEKDVALAKQTIDIIGMLAEKSQGNLDETEEQLLKEVLYNLRMRYVEAVRNT